MKRNTSYLVTQTIHFSLKLFFIIRSAFFYYEYTQQFKKRVNIHTYELVINVILEMAFQCSSINHLFRLSAIPNVRFTLKII